jgi:TRAP transporter 4TM/12TM fusion protein
MGPVQGSAKGITVKRLGDLIVGGLAFLAAIYHFAYAFWRPWTVGEHAILHVGIVCLLVALAQAQSPGRVRRWLSIIALLLAVAATPYLFVNADDIDIRFGIGLTTGQMIAGIAIIVAAIVLCWLEWGGVVAGFGIASLAYFFFGSYLPGPLAASPHPSFDYAMTFLISNGASGIFGQVTPISANVIFLFMIFGALLETTGVTRLFFELGNWFSRFMRGGAAAGAVVSSSLLGTVTGATVANVAIAGAFTIPSMKKQGFKPEDAGGIETIASCGGQILPPVMGVGAFVMAANLGVPYIEVAAMALIPAILYYASVFIGVAFLVRRNNIQRIVEPVDGSAIRAELLPFLVPLTVLTVLLLQAYSPTTAVIFAIASICAVTFLRPETWRSSEGFKNALSRIGAGLISGARQGAALGVVMAVTSLLAQSLITTAMAPKFASAVAALVGGNMLFGLILVMIAALVLGIGLPTVAAYIMAAIMLVPALTRIGVAPEAAHMFAFYFAVFAAVTPPAAEAAQVASRIANAGFWQTCAASMRLMVGPVLIPFIFVYHAALLGFAQSPFDLIVPLAAWAIGTVALSALAQRYGVSQATLFDLALLTASSVLVTLSFIWNDGVWLAAAGLTLVATFVLQSLRDRGAPSPSSPAR